MPPFVSPRNRSRHASRLALRPYQANTACNNAPATG